MSRCRSILLPFLFSALAAQARAENSGSDRPDFAEHLVVDPNTVGHLKFSYDSAPGMPFFVRTMNGAVLLSALQLGIGERVEIGTAPAFYLSESGSYLTRNVTTKWNFYRTSALSVAIGYMFTYTEVALPKTMADESPAPWPSGRWRTYSNGLTLTGAASLTDRLSLGASTSANIMFSNYALLNTPIRRQLAALETYMDLSYRVASPLSVTVGVTRTRATVSAVDLGAGGTVTWHRPGCLFSKPAFGAHHLFTQQHDGLQQPRNVYLISTTFY